MKPLILKNHATEGRLSDSVVTNRVPPRWPWRIRWSRDLLTAWISQPRKSHSRHGLRPVSSPGAEYIASILPRQRQFCPRSPARHVPKSTVSRFHHTNPQYCLPPRSVQENLTCQCLSETTGARHVSAG
jgi:hypothetical protein